MPENKPIAIIVDIDGCLAPISENVPDWHNEKECQKYYKSVSADRRMVELVNSIYSLALVKRCAVIICTARPTKYKQITKTWLSQNKVLHDFLVMRPDGDETSDKIVKEYWYNRISAKYDIWFAIEDRPKVVEMWRSHGVLCLQCNEGY